MRLGVFHEHVMVSQLLILGQIKAIEHTFQSLAGEFGADIIAGKLGSQGNGMKSDFTGAAKLTRDGGDVKGGGRFILHFDMLDYGVFAGVNFRYPIGEIADITDPDVAFHHRQFSVRLRDDQVARKDGFSVLGRR